MAKDNKSGKPEWYPLDNAGVLYSAIQKERYSAIYRFSAVMEERVDSAALQRAVNRTMPRFPSFGVRIKKGAFWYYCEPNSSPGPFIREDISNPCQPVRFREDGGWLVRFYYYERRISIEVFHAISDGGGALVFFKTLLAVYLRELGYAVPNECGILDVDQPPKKEEREDAYARYAGKRVLRAPLGEKAYPNTGTPEPFYSLNVTMGFLPLDILKEKAKSYGVSITEYLTAVLMKVLVEKQHRERPRRERPVALAIPINLRAWFPSKTLRNFITMVFPVVDPRLGDYTFEEIVIQVRNYMRYFINEKFLRGDITTNANTQRNPLIRVVPLFIKDFVVRQFYTRVQDKNSSAGLTNMGALKVPEKMAPHIERFDIYMGQPFSSRTNCAVVSFEDTLTVNFASSIMETDVERYFFRKLVNDKIHVKIESNRQILDELI